MARAEPPNSLSFLLSFLVAGLVPVVLPLLQVLLLVVATVVFNAGAPPRSRYPRVRLGTYESAGLDITLYASHLTNLVRRRSYLM